jgi:hypothetical protein
MKKIIYSQINKLCIDIPQSDIKNGQHLQIWEKHGGDNQKWIFEDDGSIVSAINKKYCIDIPQSDIKNGQHLQIWEKHGGDNQKWDFKRDS